MIFDNAFTTDDTPTFKHYIKVIGVGGGGSNAVTRMFNLGIKDVDYLICNTDKTALDGSPVPNRMQLGSGLGAGTNPVEGRKEAELSIEQINKLFDAPTQMVFITAGMGGGTGTGAAPLIAELAQKAGMLTVVVVTYPFSHEGDEKIQFAEEGIEKLRQHADTVLVVKNDRIIQLYKSVPRRLALQKIDDVLANAVKCIAEMITLRGEQNIDFRDVKTVLQKAGKAVMGVAEADGPERAIRAIEAALNSPLLDDANIAGAKRILLTYTHSTADLSHELTIEEQEIITNYIQERIGRRAMLFKDGAVFDDSLGDTLKLTVVAAGFDDPASAETPIVPLKFASPEKFHAADAARIQQTLDDAQSITRVAGYNYFNPDRLRQITQTPAYIAQNLSLPQIHFRPESSKLVKL
jgi:cell division protein FtsZ